MTNNSLKAFERGSWIEIRIEEVPKIIKKLQEAYEEHQEQIEKQGKLEEKIK